MTKVVLYFGSFNPVHRGHLMIASEAVEAVGADELWFVVSPQNPFKAATELAAEEHRLAMVEIAIEGYGDGKYLRASDIEFAMARPSRTINTLDFLRANYPGHEFVLLMGSDNAVNLEQWTESERIVATTPIFVYPREGYDCEASAFAHKFNMIEVEGFLDFMATDVRAMIARGEGEQKINEVLPLGVLNYIETNDLYR